MATLFANHMPIPKSTRKMIRIINAESKQSVVTDEIDAVAGEHLGVT